MHCTACGYNDAGLTSVGTCYNCDAVLSTRKAYGDDVAAAYQQYLDLDRRKDELHEELAALEGKINKAWVAYINTKANSNASRQAQQDLDSLCEVDLS